MEVFVYLNGQWLPRSQARVSVLDQGLLRGDGCFETVRIWKGSVPLLNDHLDRLYHAANLVQLTIPVPQEEMAQILREAVQKNKVQEGKLRIVVTRGVGDSMDPVQDANAPT